MLNEQPEGGLTDITIAFPGMKSSKKYRPIGDYIRVEYSPSTQEGGIVLPGKVQMEFVTCTALECGPECKVAKGGDSLLLATKAIMKTQHDGLLTFFTKESAILAVVE
jgi:hypothetical protein